MKKIIITTTLGFFLHATDSTKNYIPTQSPISLEDLAAHINSVHKTIKQPALSTQKVLDMLIAQQDVVMLKFAAPWCPPCKQWAPIVRQVAHDNKQFTIHGKQIFTTVVEINIDKFRDIMSSYKVKSIPTAIYFAHGKQVNRTHGALNKYDTYKKLEEAAYKAIHDMQ